MLCLCVCYEYGVVWVAGFRKKKYRKPHKVGGTVKNTTTNIVITTKIISNMSQGTWAAEYNSI